MPATNTDYWRSKIARNIERYSYQVAKLEASGWVVFTLWECELKDEEILASRLKLFLDE